MKLIKKLKQKVISKCSECGYRASNNRVGTLASWFFHEQLCNCQNDLSPPKLIANPPNLSLQDTVKIDNANKIDFGQQYESLEIIGQGGMGTVYKAIDKSTEQMVSIKVLHNSLAADQNILKRFEQEALSVQKLSHPNIVSIKKFGHLANGAPYIVMDYIEGDNLAKLIKKCGYLSVLNLLSIIFQISDAIDHAHQQGIIHRDLKPSNIIVCINENGFAVKVVDFGIAKAMSNPAIDEAQLTQTGDIVGSPAYMSPEQCLGEPVDARSDIYSLGCIMYEVLTGRNPFLSKNPVQAIVKQIEADAEPFEIEFSHLHIPKAMEKIILKCLQKDPANRYTSVKQLDKDLQRLGKQTTYIIRRFAATIIDLVLAVLASLFASEVFHSLKHICVPGDYIMMVIFAVILIYYAGFEAWMHCTPGKFLFGLRILGKNDKPMGIVRSTLRISLLLVAFVACFTAFIMAGSLSYFFIFDAENFPLTFGLGCILTLSLYWLPIIFSKSNQSLIDRLFHRSVVSADRFYLLVQKPTKQLTQDLNDPKSQHGLLERLS